MTDDKRVHLIADFDDGTASGEIFFLRERPLLHPEVGHKTFSVELEGCSLDDWQSVKDMLVAVIESL